MKKLLERSGDLGGRLTATQRRKIDKVLSAWKPEKVPQNTDQGDFDAQCNMGTLNKQGLGAPKNTAKALSRFRKAA